MKINSSDILRNKGIRPFKVGDVIRILIYNGDEYIGVLHDNDNCDLTINCCGTLHYLKIGDIVSIKNYE